MARKVVAAVVTIAWHARVEVRVTTVVSCTVEGVIPVRRARIVVWRTKPVVKIIAQTVAMACVARRVRMETWPATSVEFRHHQTGGRFVAAARVLDETAKIVVCSVKQTTLQWQSGVATLLWCSVRTEDQPQCNHCCRECH